VNRTINTHECETPTLLFCAEQQPQQSPPSIMDRTVSEQSMSDHKSPAAATEASIIMSSNSNLNNFVRNSKIRRKCNASYKLSVLNSFMFVLFSIVISQFSQYGK